MIALYKFRFYELDQSLEVGEEREFAFFIDPHHGKASADVIYPDTLLVFANTLLIDTPVVRHHCRIHAIEHPTLGAVRAISTRGLDYALTLENGSTLTVNAEEAPGQIHGSNKTVTDWAFIVNLEPTRQLGVS